MRISKILFSLFFLILSFIVPAQERGTGPKEKTFKAELKSNKQLRFERRERRKKERAEKKAIKNYHKRLQTKKVRKRMKASKNAAVRYNDNKREFFMKRWFIKKKRVRNKK